MGGRSVITGAQTSDALLQRASQRVDRRLNLFYQRREVGRAVPPDQQQAGLQVTLPWQAARGHAPRSGTANQQMNSLSFTRCRCIIGWLGERRNGSEF